jgi:hypothetical protein
MWIWSLPYGRQKFLMQFAEPINWDLLRTECPLEWKPVRDEIDGVKGNLTNTYDEVIDYIGGRAAPVDVPG